MLLVPTILFISLANVWWSSSFILHLWNLYSLFFHSSSCLQSVKLVRWCLDSRLDDAVVSVSGVAIRCSRLLSSTFQAAVTFHRGTLYRFSRRYFHCFNHSPGSLALFFSVSWVSVLLSYPLICVLYVFLSVMRVLHLTHVPSIGIHLVVTFPSPFLFKISWIPLGELVKPPLKEYAFCVALGI